MSNLATGAMATGVMATAAMATGAPAAAVAPVGPAPLARLQGVPATVVGGYLGAGKTTLINGWIRVAAHNDAGLGAGSGGWALLVNDIGAINVDAERLRHGNGKGQGTVLELGGGCVCCSLRDGLGSALLQLASRPEPPAHVLIETSGMAIPLRVADQLRLHGLAVARLLLVVDLERIEQLWIDPWVGELVQRQFEGVDLLQFSKGDRLEAAIADQRRAWLRQRLQERGSRPAPPGHEARDLVRSDAWLQLQPIRRSDLRRWAEGLGEPVLRAKGEVWLEEESEGPVPFDRVGDRLEIADRPSRPWSGTLQRRGSLVVISRAGADAPVWPIGPLAVHGVSR